MLIAAFMMITTASIAQSQTASTRPAWGGETFLGPVAGFGDSWVGYMPGGNAMFRPSGYIGVGMVHLVNEHWGWGGQLRLSSEGYQVDYYGNEQTFKPVYLRVPVRAYYYFGNHRDLIRPNIYLGPSFGMKLTESSTTSNAYQETYAINNSSYFRNFDAGIDGGGGLDIRLSRNTWLNLGLEYYQGITDAVKDPANTYNPNYDVDLNLGLIFGLR